MITLVCGFGRCGSSMVMQMLNAGGLPCVGKWPLFEDARFVFTQPNLFALKDCDGMAVKVLDPHRFTFPSDLEYRTIWLDRDLRQQAKSTVKFQKRVMDMDVTRADIGGCMQLLRSDRPYAIDALRKLTGRSPLVLRFESILSSPEVVAQILSGYCGGLDVDAMVRVVVRRGAKCLDDFLETELITRGASL